MSSASEGEKALSFNRPLAELKNVSSWKICVGPESVSAFAMPKYRWRSSIRALISIFLAMGLVASNFFFHFGEFCIVLIDSPIVLICRHDLQKVNSGKTE